MKLIRKYHFVCVCAFFALHIFIFIFIFIAFRIRYYNRRIARESRLISCYF